MRTKAEFSSLTQAELEQEIAIRQALLQQMVGTLYPSILNDELYELRKLLSDLKFSTPRTP